MCFAAFTFNFFLYSRLGYGSESMDPPSGSCSMTPSGQSFVSVNISSRTSFVMTATRFGTPYSVGYICEKESKSFFKCTHIKFDMKVIN